MGPGEIGFRAGQLVRALVQYWRLKDEPLILDLPIEPGPTPPALNLPDRDYCAASLQELEFFGQPLPKEPGWPNLFPDSGETALATRLYFRSSPAKYKGAIKNLAELNKLYHLPRLALAFADTGNADFARAAQKDLTHWAALNPFMKGLNWKSGIELAIRLTNIVAALVIFARYREVNLASYAPLVDRTLDQIHNTKSKFSSRGNHSIVEVIGELFGAYFLNEIGGDRSVDLAALDAELAQELDVQVSADGCGSENSYTYNMLNLESALWAVLLFRALGHEPSETILQRTSAGLDFTLALCDENDNAPRFGDDDSATLFKVVRDTELETAARVANVRSLARHLGMMDSGSSVPTNFDALLGAFSAPLTASRQAQAQAQVPEKTIVYGKEITVANLGDGRSKFVNLTKAYSHPPFFGHAHSDCNSLWWSFHGLPILADTGSYSYTRKLKERNAFRSVQNHNTFWVEGVPDSEFVAPFIQKPNSASSLVALSEADEEVRVLTERRYLEPADLTVRRELVLSETGLEVADEVLQGAPASALRQAFVFGPSVEVLEVIDEQSVELRVGERRLSFRTTGCLTSQDPSQLVTGYSARFNSMQQVVRLETAARDAILTSRLDLTL